MLTYYFNPSCYILHTYSGKVLSERLKDLEQKGIIKREVIPETPVIIEYSLTKKGYSLSPVLKELENWSQSWVEIENVEA